MQFSAPSTGGSGASVNDFDGHLVVVEPREYVAAIQTSFGEKDAVRCTVHDITAGTTSEDVLFFPRVLIGAFKSKVGEKVLGVIGRGQAKPGQAAPWIISDASSVPEAVQAAITYLTSLEPLPQFAPAYPAVDSAADALAAALGNLQAAGLSK